jgi:hypothetical protein
LTELPKITEKITKIIDADDVEKGAKDCLTEIRLVEIRFNGKPRSVHGVQLKNVKFVKCLFTHKIIENINFQHCIFEECQFNGATIKNSEFHQCTFTDSVFYKARISGTYLDPASFKFSAKWYYRWANVNAWWYQALYRNYKDIHQESFARVADQKFQFYRRYEHLFGQRKQPLRFLKSFLYDLALGYGYGVWNALAMTCIMISLFSLCIRGNTNLPENSGILEHIYFSMVSFTTVGYGEITPVHSTIALSVTTIFLFLSVIWGSIVTAVIVKRLVE